MIGSSPLSKLKDFAAQMGAQEFTGDAGAGMIKVTVDGKMHVIKVEIDPEVFAKTAPEMVEDLEFMADLFKAATNQAIQKASQSVIETFSGGLLPK